MPRLRLVFSVFSLLVCCVVTAQERDTAAILSIAQGINTTDAIFYEIEGYKVFVERVKGRLNEKGFKKIRRKYALNNTTVDSIDNTRILTSFVHLDNSIRQAKVYYISQLSDSEIQIVGFETVIDRDTALERFFQHAIVTGQIPESVMTSRQIDTINFAGRKMALGPACKWMSVRNIRCPRLGQFNWSEFRTEEKAKKMIQCFKALGEGRDIGTVIEEKMVDVLFEDEKTVAVRQRVKIKVPKALMGGSNELIVYYVTAKVRERHIACILSHYSDEANDGELPQLLKEVMQLIPEP